MQIYKKCVIKFLVMGIIGVSLAGCEVIAIPPAYLMMKIAGGEHQSVYIIPVYGTVVDEGHQPLNNCVLSGSENTSQSSKNLPINSRFRVDIRSFEKPKNFSFSIDCGEGYEIYTSKTLSEKNYQYDAYIEGEGRSLNVGEILIHGK